MPRVMVERPQLEVLNGLRGVAAIAVVIFHMSSALEASVAPSGYLAVDFFFVLSGFVICRAYEDRLQKGMEFWTFMWKRALRFYPLYLLGTLLGLVVMTAARTLDGQQLLTSAAFALAYLPSPVTDGLFPLNVPAWSLFFELLVNGLFAAIFWRMSNRLLSGLAVEAMKVVHPGPG